MALMLRKKMDGKTYLDGPWPKEYNLAPRQLAEFAAAGYAEDSGDKITFHFADGESATYKVKERTDSEIFTTKGGK